MAGSGLMGRGIGSRKIAPVLEQFPDILEEGNVELKIQQLKTVEGIEQKTATMFVGNIPRFVQFLKDCKLEYKLVKENKEKEKKDHRGGKREINTNDVLYGKHIVMTKVRDSAFVEAIEKRGAVFDEVIKKSTFVLIVKTKDDVSNKTKFANENAIPIMTVTEFRGVYL
jgi:hypothetical protein